MLLADRELTTQDKPDPLVAGVGQPVMVVDTNKGAGYSRVKPWQNGSTESFNGKFRDECLAMEWFRNRIEAKVVIGDWRRHYNTVRPHSSLDYATPEAFSRKQNASLLTGATPDLLGPKKPVKSGGNPAS